MTKITHDDFDESSIYGEPRTPFVMAPPVSATQIDGGNNPLKGYFRMAGLTVHIPTSGAFFPSGTFFPNDNGSVDILPMRGADELLMNSPDALMSNKAIIELLRSCVPQIKRPELISTPDLDVLLLAIKVASSGETMTIDLKCPKCDEHTALDVNVPALLEHTTTVDPVNMVRLGDEMTAEVVPFTLAIQTKMILDSYTITRLSQAFDANTEIDDTDRAAEASRIIQMINDVNMFGIKNSVKRIIIPGSEVTKREFIEEFIENTDRAVTKAIKEKIDDINSRGVNRNIKGECGHCKHTWELAIEFDPASFFGNG